MEEWDEAGPFDEEDDAEEPAHYLIESDEDADLAMKRLVYYRAEAERIEKLAEAERQRVEERRLRLLRKPAERIAFYEQNLVLYHQRVRPDGKRVDLINGALTSTAGRTQLRILDEDQLVSFLEVEEMTDLLAVEKVPRRAEIKKFMAERGYTDLPGAELLTGERTWRVVPERPI